MIFRATSCALQPPFPPPLPLYSVAAFTHSCRQFCVWILVFTTSKGWVITAANHQLIPLKNKYIGVRCLAIQSASKCSFTISISPVTAFLTGSPVLLVDFWFHLAYRVQLISPVCLLLVLVEIHQQPLVRHVGEHRDRIAPVQSQEPFLLRHQLYALGTRAVLHARSSHAVHAAAARELHPLLHHIKRY